ncbi:cellulase family glycosylhydrolase [Demequina aurantiaca]|uniref:cellulase family glycosylhydrolase n=1 Tax=Demequina aurantiaca TaxID=676200 RepID=UPI0009FEE40B|nr:cellulase family glycosylhydrolase [Demequina aurantiaca]
MKRLLTAAMGAALLLGGMVAAPAAHAAAGDGFSVSGGKIFDANGNEFVPVGINHAHTWYPDTTGVALSDIRSTGANAVRVVLSGGRWGTNSATEVASIIDDCKNNELVCILEDHDTTGYGEASGATSLASAAQYWTSLAPVLKGQEDYVMINLGNEPFGNAGFQNWASDTISAISTLRAAGLNHTLVADAPNWGQDWSFTMRDNAATVAQSDDNVVFSIHMYGVFDTGAEVRAYLDSFTSRNLAIMVGEFGDHHSDGNPDEDAIMSYTRSQGIGMLGWSWSGNGSGVEYLDMVNNFSANSLTPWGQRFLNGSNGLAERNSPVASVFSGTGGGDTGGGDTGGGDTGGGDTGGTAPNGYPYCSTAASDPDGDGWGWENSASCVVHGSAADTSGGDTGGGDTGGGDTGGGDTGGTAPNGYPYCSSAASDPDGDGWGWENSASCVVRGTAADSGNGSGQSTTAPNGYRYCSSPSADPDGDGWGWENSASCVVRGSAADH